jgi:hypothetical protein
MLEQEVIQFRGFKNTIENGKIVGFEVPYRLTLYRGNWLPQMTEATITVNGELFQGDEITWTIGGKTYQQKDLKNYPNVHWSPLEPCIFKVKKPGGLKLGIYEVSVSFGTTSSYTSYPFEDITKVRITTQTRTMTLGG